MSIIIVLLLSSAFGALLATQSGLWPVSAGMIGAGVMLAAAVAVRRHWLLLRDAAPGTPERALWLSLASLGINNGFLVTALIQIGPAMELHNRIGHALGRDAWTLAIAGLIAYVIARDPEPRVDERDAQIAALGTRAGYWAQSVLLLILVPLIGFHPDYAHGPLSLPMVAHLLIVALTLAWIIDLWARLRVYRADARAALEAQ